MAIFNSKLLVITRGYTQETSLNRWMETACLVNVQQCSRWALLPSQRYTQQDQVHLPAINGLVWENLHRKPSIFHDFPIFHLGLSCHFPKESNPCYPKKWANPNGTSSRMITSLRVIGCHWRERNLVEHPTFDVFHWAYELCIHQETRQELVKPLTLDHGVRSRFPLRPIRPIYGVCNLKPVLFQLVVWNMAFITFHILGISSSQLTNSYFSEGLKPPTRYCFSMFW